MTDMVNFGLQNGKNMISETKNADLWETNMVETEVSFSTLYNSLI